MGNPIADALRAFPQESARPAGSDAERAKAAAVSALANLKRDEVSKRVPTGGKLLPSAAAEQVATADNYAHDADLLSVLTSHLNEVE